MHMPRCGDQRIDRKAFEGGWQRRADSALGCERQRDHFPRVQGARRVERLRDPSHDVDGVLPSSSKCERSLTFKASVRFSALAHSGAETRGSSVGQVEFGTASAKGVCARALRRRTHPTRGVTSTA